MTQMRFNWSSLLDVLFQQLVNIPFRYWTRQHAVFWVSASRHISPTDECYWENGVKLDDVCHRVKHLRRDKMQAAVNITLSMSACWSVFLNLPTHIIWSLSCSQDVLARAVNEPYFYIVNLLVVIHSQHQGFTVGVHGAVSYQKCSILMWLTWQKKTYLASNTHFWFISD